ncbi:S-adenosyl-L-methionine-dependent methyltransferase [Mycena sp. CBHHK59/15]|nr:S-adenosyl-L-methionine-dependent methyltransferase [Mycena sp. CBHHK59/15]
MELIPTLWCFANIITDAVNTMEHVYGQNLMAAAAQISATVCDPMRTAVNTSHMEILCEAGPKGTDAKEIAALSHTNPGLITQILRLLTAHHIFREVSLGVFTNNRISSTLNKGKPSSILFSKLIGSSGVAVLSRVYLTDSLLNPSEKRLPYNLACATDEPLFTWMQHPENHYNLSRFAVAMQGTAATEPPELIFQGMFRLSLLRSRGVLVDVGGGIGHSSLLIAKKYPGLRVVNQELGPPSIHDFFTPQPVKNAVLFLLRYILHNWLDVQVGTILKHLCDVALPTTTLVVIEKIQLFASKIPGAAWPTASPPLLPNWGAATADLCLYDINMHIMFGGVECTLEGLYDVLAAAQWKLVEVHHCPGSQLSHLIAVPL